MRKPAKTEGREIANPEMPGRDAAHAVREMIYTCSPIEVC
jgi:hypothetical protein